MLAAALKRNRCQWRSGRRRITPSARLFCLSHGGYDGLQGRAGACRGRVSVIFGLSRGPGLRLRHRHPRLTRAIITNGIHIIQ